MSLVGPDGFVRPSYACDTTSFSLASAVQVPRATRRCLGSMSSTRPATSRSLAPTRGQCVSACSGSWWLAHPCLTSSCCCSSSPFLAPTMAVATTVAAAASSTSFPTAPQRPSTAPAAASCALLAAASAPWSRPLLRSRSPAFSAASGGGGGGPARRARLVLCRAGAAGGAPQQGIKCRYCGLTLYPKTYSGHHWKSCKHTAADSSERERRVAESEADLQKLLRRHAASVYDEAGGGSDDGDPDAGTTTRTRRSAVGSGSGQEAVGRDQRVSVSGGGTAVGSSAAVGGGAAAAPARVRSAATTQALPRAYGYAPGSAAAAVGAPSGLAGVQAPRPSTSARGGGSGVAPLLGGPFSDQRADVAFFLLGSQGLWPAGNGVKPASGPPAASGAPPPNPPAVAPGPAPAVNAPPSSIGPAATTDATSFALPGPGRGNGTGEVVAGSGGEGGGGNGSGAAWGSVGARAAASVNVAGSGNGFGSEWRGAYSNGPWPRGAVSRAPGGQGAPTGAHGNGAAPSQMEQRPPAAGPPGSFGYLSSPAVGPPHWPLQQQQQQQWQQQPMPQPYNRYPGSSVQHRPPPPLPPQQQRPPPPPPQQHYNAAAAGVGAAGAAAGVAAGGGGGDGSAASAVSRMFLDDGGPAAYRPPSSSSWPSYPRPADRQPSAAELHLATVIREGQQAAARKQYRRPKLEPLRWEGFDEKDPFFSSLLPAAREWLMSVRRLPEEVLRRNRIHCTLVPCGGGQPPRPAVAFPFFRTEHPDSVAFVKYRLFDPAAPQPFARKEFRSSLHGEPIMYGTNDIVSGGHTDVIIVEGEMDKLALNAAGFWNVVSVPNGAPAATTGSATSPPEQIFVRPHERDQLQPRVRAHYAYLEPFLASLAPGGDLARCRFTLATDTDPAGAALRRELLRRLGRERCWEVISWDNEDELDEQQLDGLGPAVGPTTSYASPPGTASSSASTATAPVPTPVKPPGARKDANEVLMRDGPAQLVALMEAAQPAKVAGLATFREYEMEIAAYFQRQDPLQLGVSTGWPCLDPFYRVAPGELTIVTGVPNSGKSEWLDALMVNLAENHGWAFALCSMEKQPLQHLKALIEKRARKPFRPVTRMTPLGWQPVEAMDLGDVVSGFNWLADHFHLIRYEEEDDTGAPTIDWVLAKARTAVLRFGIRGLLIDPYNELDSRRSRDTNETDHIREMLTKVRRFARDTECHVWFVAHPRQQKVLSGQAPGLYDISGSAHWFNKTDNGIVVHRRFEERTHPETGKRYRVALPEVEIKLQKVRNKDIGTQGEAYLLYDKATGRYEDPAVEETARTAGGVGYGGGGPVAAYDRARHRSWELGYVFNTGSYTQQQQESGAGSVIDVTLGPGLAVTTMPGPNAQQPYTDPSPPGNQQVPPQQQPPIPSPRPHQSYSAAHNPQQPYNNQQQVAAQGGPSLADPVADPFAAVATGLQRPPPPTAAVVPGVHGHHPSAAPPKPQPLSSPTGMDGTGATQLRAPACGAAAAEGGGSSSPSPSRSPFPSPSTSTALQTSMAPEVKVKAGKRPGIKEEQSRNINRGSAAGPAAKTPSAVPAKGRAASGGRGRGDGGGGGVFAGMDLGPELLEILRAEEAKEAAGRGRNMGWQVQPGQDEEDGEDDWEEEGWVGVPRRTPLKRINGGSGGGVEEVMVEVDGQWVPKEQEGVGSLAGLLAENEGAL